MPEFAATIGACRWRAPARATRLFRDAKKASKLLQFLLDVSRAGTRRRKFEIDPVGLFRFLGFAGSGARVAEVEIRDGPGRVQLDRVFKPARSFRIFILFLVNEAEVVGGQREVRAQLQRFGELGFGGAVLLFLV